MSQNTTIGAAPAVALRASSEEPSDVVARLPEKPLSKTQELALSYLRRAKTAIGDVAKEAVERALVAAVQATAPHGPQLVSDLKVADAQAISAIESSLIGGAEARSHIAQWLNGIRAAQEDGRKLDVVEHSALTFIIRTGLFEELPEVKTQLDACLAKSWEALTGKKRNPKQLIARLPRAVLMQTHDLEARSIHAAAFQNGGVAEKYRFHGRDEVALFQDYVPEKSDIAAAAAVVALALGVTNAAPALGGMFVGYAMYTLGESLAHKYGFHATKEVKEWVKQPGLEWLAAWVDNVTKSHGVHHGTYAKDYAARFKEPGSREKLDKMLIEKFGDLGREIIADDYGVSLSKKTAVEFLGRVAPFFLGAAALLGSAPAAAGVMIGPALWLWASSVAHQYGHMSEEEASAKAGPLMRLAFQSRLFRMMAQGHFVHHQRGGNYNLGPGGDMLLNEYKKIHMGELLAMRKKGLIR